MKYVERIKDVDLLSNSFLKINTANFVVNRSDIIRVEHDKSKKWGMGYYPHDGKVYVTTHDNSTREFIILGSQSGQEISNRIK